MAIASVSEAEPIFPASGITILPPVVIRPPPVYVPAPVTFAPLKVRAVVVPDFIIRLPELFVALPKVVPASLKNISAPSPSRIISPLESNVISVPSFVIVSRAIPPTLVMSASLKLVAPKVFYAAVEVNPAAIVTPPPSAI